MVTPAPVVMLAQSGRLARRRLASSRQKSITFQCAGVSSAMPSSLAIADGDFLGPLGWVGHEAFVVDLHGLACDHHGLPYQYLLLDSDCDSSSCYALRLIVDLPLSTPTARR